MARRQPGSQPKQPLTENHFEARNFGFGLKKFEAASSRACRTAITRCAAVSLTTQGVCLSFLRRPFSVRWTGPTTASSACR